MGANDPVRVRRKPRGCYTRCRAAGRDATAAAGPNWLAIPARLNDRARVGNFLDLSHGIMAIFHRVPR